MFAFVVVLVGIGCAVALVKMDSMKQEIARLRDSMAAQNLKAGPKGDPGEAGPVGPQGEKR